MKLDELIASSRAVGAEPRPPDDRERIRLALAAKLAAATPSVLETKPPPYVLKRGGARRIPFKVLLAAAAVICVVSSAAALEVRHLVRLHAQRAKEAEAQLAQTSASASAHPEYSSNGAPTPGPSTSDVPVARSGLPTVAPEDTPPADSALSKNASPRAADHHRRATTGGSDDAMTDEMVFVQSARNSLKSGNASDTLRAIDRYQSKYPKGTFRQEMAALRVLALCDLGRVDEARAKRASLERAWPNAPMLPRLRASCAGEKTSP